uniref:Uncharacterized protein n=1 Tax=Wolbachia endosymbiont of Aleurodicus dispersus TaxID=1288877 RepID=A0A3B0IWA2_9RICK
MLGTSHSIDYPTNEQHPWQALEYETEKNNYRYNLQTHDIMDIARIMHKWDKGYEEVNYKTQFYEENQQGERVYYSRTQSKVIFDVFSLENLTQKLKDFKGDWNIRSKLPLMAIINLGDFRWVTLFIAYSDSKKPYYAYYCDSFKVGVHSEVKKNLESQIPSIVIVDLSSKQQEYSYDSGIFALDSAKKINEMLDKDRFLRGTYNANLLSREQLIEKRKEFSQKLLNSYGRTMFIESKFIFVNSIPQSDHTELLNLAAEKEYWKIAVSALRQGANVGNLNNNQKVKLYSYIKKHDLNFIGQYPQIVKLLIEDVFSNKDFLNLYKKILKQVVSSLIESGQAKLNIENLILIVISNINKLESRQLGEYIESDCIDELKKYLVRYDTMSKHLSPLLLKSEYLIDLLSSLKIRLLDFGICSEDQGENYPFNRDFLSFTNVESLHLPTFLSMLKALDDYNVLHSADYSTIDEISRNMYSHLRTNRGSKREIAILSQQLDFSLRHTSKIRKLIIACLKGEGEADEMKRSATDILRVMQEDQRFGEISYPVFAFLSFLKALVFRGSRNPFSILDDVFNNINYGDLLSSNGYIEAKDFKNRLQDDGYSDYVPSDSDESLDCGIYNFYIELRKILNVLDQVELLKYIVLFSGNDVSVLDSVWERLISFQETQGFSFVKNSLSTHLLLQNNINIINWYNEKLQEVNSNVVDLIADVWNKSVSYGSGVYDEITAYSSLKLAFNLQENYSSEDLFIWFFGKLSAQEQVSFDVRGLVCELAVRTKRKENLSIAIGNLLPHIDSIEDQFLYTRLVAAIVIENNVDNMLEIFWTEISKIQNEGLQNDIKKRALIDGTWAFHQALKNGNMNIVEWIWSKVNELSKEENIRNEYRYILLYGLDLSGIDSTQKGPIYNAALSGSIDVLSGYIGR